VTATVAHHGARNTTPPTMAIRTIELRTRVTDYFSAPTGSEETAP
jgi:hypothetical protein